PRRRAESIGGRRDSIFRRGRVEPVVKKTPGSDLSRTGDNGEPEANPPQRDDRHPLSVCPTCQSRHLHYVFSHQQYRVVRCADCHMVLLNPQPSDAELGAIYSSQYFLGSDTADGRERMAQMKSATARQYLEQLQTYRG